MIIGDLKQIRGTLRWGSQKVYGRWEQVPLNDADEIAFRLEGQRGMAPITTGAECS
jgi:hypothetical protein